MGAHNETQLQVLACQSHRRLGEGGDDGDYDNELLDMLEIPERALVDDIRDDESEESVKVLLRYCGCTDEAYGEGGRYENSFDVTTENTASYETSGDDNDLIENIESIKTAEDNGDVDETGTEDGNNCNLLQSPSGNIEIIITAEDNADVNETGSKDGNNCNLLPSPSGKTLMNADEIQDDEVRDEVNESNEVNESMDNSKNLSIEGSSNDGIVDEDQQHVNNDLTSTDKQPNDTASTPDDDPPLEEEPDNDVPFNGEPDDDVPLDGEPDNDVPFDEEPEHDAPFDEDPNNYAPIDEQPGKNTPFDEHPNQSTHQAISNKSEKKTKHVREYNIRCSNHVNSIHSVRAVEVDMLSSSRRCYPIISPPVRKVALSLHNVVQKHPTPTTNYTESRDQENAHHSALSTVSDRDDLDNKEVKTAEVREEEKDPVPVATLKTSDPLNNLEEMDMDMLIKSTRAWLKTEKAERKVRSETHKAEWKDIEIFL